MNKVTNEPPVCAVCRRSLAATEDYLVRLRGDRPTAVHRHLCFPPVAAGASPLTARSS
jgi:hypothetical protein